MDQRADYLIQILDKIGGPLIAALMAAEQSEQDNKSDSTKSQAQTVAQLLSRSVQMSIEIGKIMDLNMADPAQSDKFRLALMSLAGPMVAGQFVHDGKVPADPEQKKIMTALEAILTFSDNFTASQDNADQLKSLDESTGIVGQDEMMLHTVRHFVPIVNAVAAFPFGQSEKKLIQEISTKVSETAKTLSEILAKGLSTEQKTQAKLKLIKALAEIYAGCHHAETKRMSDAGADDSLEDSGMKKVWKEFEIRAAMLETLSATLMPGSAEEGTSESSSPSHTGEESNQEPVPASPPPPAATSTESSAGVNNPMAMFAQKKTDEEGERPPTSTENPETQPVAPEESQELPQVQTPSVSVPPAATPEEEVKPDTGGNPMAMFAQKKKDDVEKLPSSETPPSEIQAPAEPPVAPESAALEQQESSEDGKNDKEDKETSGGENASPMSFFKKTDEE